jgi:anti-sigma-K factor RskA
MTTDNGDHRALRESAALYAANALPKDERRVFEAHLGTCAECARELESFGAVVLHLSLAVPQIDPPPSLRERLIRLHRVSNAGAATAATRPRTRASRWHAGWLSAAAVLIVGFGLVRYTSALRQQIDGLQQQLQDARVRLDRSERQLDAATRAVGGAQLRMAVLTAPDLARVDLTGQTPAPRATGRAFWSRTRGLVFAASALPPLPAGRTYQLWVVTARQPISAGLVRPDDAGAVTAFFATPPDIPPPVAMAVTIEPDGGVPAPTGDKYLIGAAH